MAQTPVPRSYNQILGEMLDSFLADTQIPTVKVASPILSFLESAAQSTLRSSNDLFTGLKVSVLDGCEGQALDNYGRSKKIPRLTQRPSTGTVTITDSRYTKVSSNVFQGKPAPIVGSNTIYVTDGSGFTSTGSVYLGRGTGNYEGPIAYSAVTNIGSYWAITLNSATQRFHNVGETVVLAQGGDRLVSTGTLCQTPQGNTGTATQFSVVYPVTIPDGEVVVSGVLVSCQKPGVVGNVPAGNISSFVAAPFTGATVTNTLGFTNGVPDEQDSDYKERIRNIEASKNYGTDLALQTAIIGVTAPDEQKTIASAAVSRKQNQTTTIYIDDGTGYEESNTGVPVESLVDSAIGGEESFVLNERPVAKAFLTATIRAPYELSDGDELALLVGGKYASHTFDSSSFININGASAYEVVASINANSTLPFKAITSQNGQTFSLVAKSDTNEDIEVSPVTNGLDANFYFGIPLGRVYTLKLYLNDQLLTKDGTVAQVTGYPSSNWSNLSGPQTISISVDGTAVTTYTVTDSDFVNILSGYSTVAKNSLISWARVLNYKIPGVIVWASEGSLVMTSNRGRDSQASITITGGTLVTNKMFPLASVSGSTSDYTLQRNTGEITLTNALVAGDRLTVGSHFTRAFSQSSKLSRFNVTGSTANVWVVIDGSATIVPLGITASTLLTISVVDQTFSNWGNRVRVAAADGTSVICSQLQTNNTVILWDTDLNAQNRGTYRVAAVDPGGTWFELQRQGMSAARRYSRSIVLASNKVLVIGGLDQAQSRALASCELYDPTTGLFTFTGSLNFPRQQFSATLLSDGRVLVAGGLTSSSTVDATATCEIYDPTTGTWTVTGPMPVARFASKQVLLSNNKVLNVGGLVISTAQSACYLFDATAGTWSTTGALPTPTSGHTLTTLGNTDVVVAGGLNAGTVLSAVAEYSVGGGTWTVRTPLNVARREAAAVLLADGRVLVTGGFTVSANTTMTATTEAFDGGANSWTALGSMVTANAFHSITKLPDNSLLTVGGNIVDTETASATSTSWTATDALYQPQLNHTANLLNNGKVAVFGGGSTSRSLAQAFVYDPAAASGSHWSTIGATVPQTSFSLTHLGIAAVNSLAQVQQLTLPIANNYTATSAAQVLDVQINGGSATTYRTNYLRLATDTFDESGDIAVVAVDTNGALLGLTPSRFIKNKTSHLAVAIAGNTDQGTNVFAAFQVLEQNGSNSLTATTTSSANSTTVTSMFGGLKMVGLQPFDDGGHGVRSNNNLYAQSVLTSANAGTQLEVTLGTRSPLVDVAVGDRFYLAHGYAIAPRDSLSVVLDQRPTDLKFTLPFYRTLKPTSNNYSITNGFVDADNGNASLRAVFGFGANGFDFSDFAIYMAGRTLTDSGTSTKTILWRSKRLGPDGNVYRIRYDYPATANQPTSLSYTAGSSDYFDISVLLPSGAARVGLVLRTSTRVAFATTGTTGGGLNTFLLLTGYAISTGARTTNVTTITPTLPAGVTDHGIQVGDIIYINSASGSFSSGTKAVTGRTATTFDYAETAADIGSTAFTGTVSFDSTEVLFTGSGVVVNDVVSISAASGFGTFASPLKFIISSVAPQYVAGTSEVNPTSPTTGVATMKQIVDPSTISFFPLVPPTATALAASINAIATSPVSATVTGAGSGTISLSSYNLNDSPGYWYNFSDGLNWVLSTAIPGTNTGDYSFTFKAPTSSSLAVNADWQNEVVLVVPIFTKQMVAWLNSQAVTGISNNAYVLAAEDAGALELASLTAGSIGAVQVQSGFANAASAELIGSSSIINGASPYLIAQAKTTDLNGFMVGMGVALQNSAVLARPSITSTTTLTSIEANGRVTLATGTQRIWIKRIELANQAWQVTREGRFVAYSYDGTHGFSPTLTSVKEGNWVYLEVGTGSSANAGLFQVVRCDSTARVFWIENPAAIDANHTARTVFIAAGSVLPGDQLNINSNVWGAANLGQWQVASVGLVGSSYFSNEYIINLDTSVKSPQPQGAVAALGSSQVNLVQVIQGTPDRYIKFINSISPNQADPTLSDVRFAGLAGFGSVGSMGQTLMVALDKLAFPTNLITGTDGYQHSIGLIAEANRIIYGEPTDRVTYPGLAASGSQIDIQGPLIKRIQVSVSIRTKTGVSIEDVISEVRDAVASVINLTPQGQSIAISDIIDAVKSVNGVFAVGIVSPQYSPTMDLIPVQKAEKPLVLDVINDIMVSIVNS